jgi:DNA-directed RNA polymerase specialized sigma54-like protein
MEMPKTIKQGSNITLINIPTGETRKYVVCDVVIDEKTGQWKMELKRPAPDDTVDYILKIEGEEKSAKGRSRK